MVVMFKKKSIIPHIPQPEKNITFYIWVSLIFRNNFSYHDHNLTCKT